MAEIRIGTSGFQFNDCHAGYAAKNGLMMKRILGIVKEFGEEQKKMLE